MVSLALLLFRAGLIQRWDYWIYDGLIRLVAQDDAPPDDILIIGVDEKSLNELGRWPWPRRRHAQLINTLSKTTVSAIGLDILFTEPDLSDPEGDDLLAKAIKKNGRVVLPVTFEQLSAIGLTEILPLPSFTEGAANLGHVDLRLDEDGANRGIFLALPLIEWVG